MKSSKIYDHYYNYEEITKIVHEYAEKYPSLARLSSLAVSKEGRDTWLIEVTDTSKGGYSEKPAYFLNGHVHAGEVTGSMCAMYFLDCLFSNMDESEEIKKLLETTTFYVIPRPVPDGAEYYLTHPDTLRSVNEPYPFFDEMPGLVPGDLDGDGAVRTMLVESPYGAWKKAEEDPRVLVKRKPDEVGGVFYNVYSEGSINGYDGVNVFPAPAKFGLDLNRNFPVGWETGNKQAGSGFAPGDRQESQTLIQFVQGHPNICNTITFHTFSGIYLYPPGMFPKKSADPDDMKRYELITKIAQEETGFVPMNIKDDFLGDFVAKTSGSFEDFLHFGHGIYCYTVETWDLAHQAGIELHFPDPFGLSDEKMKENALKFYEWVDKNGFGSYIKPWTAIDHPQLGKVEIGGPDPKRIIQNPPVELIQQEVEKHTRFILRHAKTMPHLVFRQAAAEKISDGVYRVDAYIYNSGFMPTHILNEYKSLGFSKDITVELEGEGLTFVEGSQKQKIGQLEGFSGAKTDYFYFGIVTNKHDPIEKKVSWIVKAAAPATLKVSAWSERAGVASAEVTLA
ncbi:MAG: hypothetical protein LBC69_00440 [Eubacteriaceae bacterium]|jgi:hypothetical protein|nr:hypothetical protein [Eubacteriaceae bacterium]